MGFYYFHSTSNFSKKKIAFYFIYSHYPINLKQPYIDIINCWVLFNHGSQGWIWLVDHKFENICTTSHHPNFVYFRRWTWTHETWKQQAIQATSHAKIMTFFPINNVWQHLNWKMKKLLPPTRHFFLKTNFTILFRVSLEGGQPCERGCHSIGFQVWGFGAWTNYHLHVTKGAHIHVR